MEDDRLELFKQAAVIFEVALEQPPEDRRRIAYELAGADAALRACVEALLRRDRRASPIDTPVVRPSAELGSEPPPPRNEVCGAYRLVRRLGEGGMSSVFLGRRDDGGVPEFAAIKLLPHQLAPAALWRRLDAERSILARLDHPNIARLIDAGATESGSPYLVLEYVRGEPITEYADRRQLGVEDRLCLFSQLVDAVQYAHRHLVIHRDLKPPNVLITDDAHVKLLDFGIAKILGPDVGIEATRTAERFATPGYASPEQLAGGPISTASDLYGLGVLLHRLLTGLLPDDRPSLGSQEDVTPELASEAARKGDPEQRRLRAAHFGLTPRALQRKLRGELDAIIGRCRAPAPEARYRSAGRLGDDLRRYLAGEPTAARPLGVFHRWAKAARRHPLQATGLTALAVAFAALVVLPLLHSRTLARERDATRQAHRQTESVTRFLSDILRLANPYELDNTDRPGNGPVTLREVIDEASVRLDRNLDRDPLVRARLLATLGRAYADLGEASEAVPRLRQAVSLHRAHAPQTAALGDSLASLGFVLWDRGDATKEGRAALEEGVALLRRAAAVGRASDRAGVETGAMLARSLTDLGVVLREEGELAEARALLNEAVAESRRFDGGEGRESALATLELGFLDFREQAYDDASARLEPALSRLTSLVGAHHPDRATALYALGWTRARQGRPQEAEQMLREAHAIWLASLGETHPETIASYQQIGSLRYEQGDLRGAEQIFRRALALERAQPRFDPVHLAVDTNALGIVVWKLDGPAAAEPLAREAVTLAREHLGDDHPRTATYALNLGRILTDGGHLAAAEPLLRAALAHRTETLGADDTRVGYALAALAGHRLDAGDRAEAIQLAEQATRIARAKLGADHWRTGEAEAILGCALVQKETSSIAGASLVSESGAETGASLVPETGASLLQRGLETLRATQGVDAQPTRAAERRCRTDAPTP